MCHHRLLDVVLKMEKNENRAVIEYLHMNGLSAQQIHLDMKEVLGADAPSQATVYRWTTAFKCGRQSTEDEHRSGRPSDTCTEETINSVQDMILKDRRVTIKYVAECLKLSSGTTHHIIADVLGYNKVCARWVPRMLTVEIMRVRMQTSNRNLELYRADPDKFLRRYVTMDETWAHHFDPETKQQSMQWKHPTSPPVVKFRKVISANKVMVSVFWDSEGVLLTDYLEKGKTVTGVYYAGLIRKLREVTKEKRRGKLTQGVLLHHDNAPAHTSHVATATTHDCGFELLSHPPYSLDLAPSDFHLFRYLKESLRGRAFEDDEDVTVAVNEWIEERDENFFLEGVKTLEQRWEMCVALRGNYVEKH